MIIGYARVSTDGQTLDAQLTSLKAAGAEKVFSEKISGAVTDRKALAKAISALGPGDILLVTRLDPLARSTRDLLNILHTVSKAGAKFRSLADAWADTTTPHGELMITILAGLASRALQRRGLPFSKIRQRVPHLGGRAPLLKALRLQCPAKPIRCWTKACPSRCDHHIAGFQSLRQVNQPRVRTGNMCGG